MPTYSEGDIIVARTIGSSMYAISVMPIDALEAGEVGYISASIKNVRETKVGDTITDADNPADAPLPGYKDVF